MSLEDDADITEDTSCNFFIFKTGAVIMNLWSYRVGQKKVSLLIFAITLTWVV